MQRSSLGRWATASRRNRLQARELASGLPFQTGMIGFAIGLLFQATAVSFDAAPRPYLEPPRWEMTRLFEAMADTGRRRRAPSVEYSDTYHTRVSIHKALSWAMVPLFIGSGYTGFQLRNKKEAAPQWVRDVHGPLAGATAVVFGMNTLTGAWNLWEGRKDPAGRTKRLVHGALFLAAAAGFTYVTAAGDDIRAYGKPNHWHRDIALASMSVSLVSWSLMLFR